MRAKQPATQLPPSSLAMTILPSAANDRGRKSRAVAEPAAAAPPAPPAPAPEPEPVPAPMEFAAAPTAPAATAPTTVPAPDWAPPAPAAAPAPDWAPPAPAVSNAPSWTPPPQTWVPPSTSRFGNPPAADYQVNHPAAPGFPPQPSYAASSGVDYLPPAAPAQVAPGQWVPQHAGLGYPGYPPAGPPGRSTASRVLIALAITVAGFIVLGILAAVVIPVFANKHHPKTVARIALLPDTLVNQQKIVSPEFSGDAASQIAQLRRTIPDVLQANAAYYGQGGLPVFSVAAGNLYPSPTAADAKSFFGTSGAGSISLTPVGSGPYGGWMECGGGTVNGQPVTTCASLDNAAVVIVSAANTTPSDLAILTRQIISSVEIKG
jgi:hypothetical protein